MTTEDIFHNLKLINNNDSISLSSSEIDYVIYRLRQAKEKDSNLENSFSFSEIYNNILKSK